MANGHLINPRPITLHASGAETATGNSGSLNIPTNCSHYALTLDVTAASGTSPTLDVAFQVTPDAGTTWMSVLRFAQQTTTTSDGLMMRFRHGLHAEAAETVTYADTGGSLIDNVLLTNECRLLFTIGGTNPSFTFTSFLFCYERDGSAIYG